MKIDAQSLKEITEMIEEAKEYANLIRPLSESIRPFVKETAGVIKDNITEFKDLFESAQAFSVEMQTKRFNSLLEKGFTREEAMLLTIDNVAARKEAVQNLKDATRKMT